MSFTYPYARPSVTADVILFAKEEGVMKILLIQRSNDPYEGYWALPGGFMDMDETTEQTAHRELEEETGISGINLNRLDVYDTPDRDPRGRTLTVAYYAVIDATVKATANDDAKDAAWFDINALPALAFDHAVVIAEAIARAGI